MDPIRRGLFTPGQPPLVGISSTFHLSFSETSRLARRLRRIDQDMKIVVGGAFANALASRAPLTDFEKPMRRPEIDFVLHAMNSETDLLSLIVSLREGYDLKDVRNLCFFDKKAQKQSFFLAASPVVWHPPKLDMVAPLG